MPRYVILEHTGSASYKPGVHWDLMLEFGDRLRAWELPATPSAVVPMDVRQLPDHRLEYLTLEGPLSGDRGHVRPWDRGGFDVVLEQPAKLVVTISGAELRGTLTFARSPANEWRLEFVPDRATS